LGDASIYEAASLELGHPFRQASNESVPRDQDERPHCLAVQSTPGDTVNGVRVIGKHDEFLAVGRTRTRAISRDCSKRRPYTQHYKSSRKETAMTLLGYDSVRPDLIPQNAQVVLPYADGPYAWAGQREKMFPRAKYALITVLGNAAIASIADVEPGRLSPKEARAFILARRDAGHRATIYSNRRGLPLIQEACKGLDYDVWLATLDGTQPTSIDGGGTLVAVQYKSEMDYLISVIWDDSWLI
jgi:hypothetical protein